MIITISRWLSDWLSKSFTDEGPVSASLQVAGPFRVVELRGFEPLTFSLRTRRYARIGVMVEAFTQARGSNRCAGVHMRRLA